MNRRSSIEEKTLWQLYWHVCVFLVCRSSNVECFESASIPTNLLSSIRRLSYVSIYFFWNRIESNRNHNHLVFERRRRYWKIWDWIEFDFDSIEDKKNIKIQDRGTYTNEVEVDIEIKRVREASAQVKRKYNIKWSNKGVNIVWFVHFYLFLEWVHIHVIPYTSELILIPGQTRKDFLLIKKILLSFQLNPA